MIIFITTAMEPAIRRKLDYLCFFFCFFFLQSKPNADNDKHEGGKKNTKQTKK